MQLGTRAVNKQIEEHVANGETVTVEDLCRFPTTHEGHCYRKSNYSSAAAEEHEAKAAAHELLLDGSGTPRDAKTCVFIDTVVADNDTRGPSNFVKEQNNIIGSLADGKAEIIPDLPHTVNNNNNEFHALMEKDPTFRGRQALTNVRVKSIQADITAAVKAYHPHVGNSMERAKCLKQLGAIIKHHCGDHSRCDQVKFCTYSQVKSDHPDWTEEQIREESQKKSKRQKSIMDLSEWGISVLERIIAKRFNAKTIDKIAKCRSSNRCEGFWSELVKLSEGKRIQGCGTDLWLSMVELCYCMSGNQRQNIKKTKQELSELLNVFYTPIKNKACDIMKKKADKDYARKASESGKRKRQMAKLSLDHRMGKDANKSKHHKSEKVPLTKMKKSKVDKCTKCGQHGHKTRECVVLKAPNKQKKQLFDWGGRIESTNEYEPRFKRHRPRDYDWSDSILLGKCKSSTK
mmetsp:Transcript_41972/g.88105  ORF Transcript_41972/g.88105 Transcript_41972/m.88105 type:complete len:460 (+) Transcript_41972:37-1416(+)|eukprot:CAMPEP_0183713738 /NCGR_PEP_ID=MMETSP0737-20130205/8496_1 /TAXON_ID=385413 /ORGANISM="Thalassiosira miniscula, Strain CCMP1093" /LENGTH=459 /DNA_ID=CAMNT_0025942565 /DNA_START=26 /DNA_END=1405 /DNA_ORIENTATION=+